MVYCKEALIMFGCLWMIMKFVVFSLIVAMIVGALIGVAIK